MEHRITLFEINSIKTENIDGYIINVFIYIESSWMESWVLEVLEGVDQTPIYRYVIYTLHPYLFHIPEQIVTHRLLTWILDDAISLFTLHKDPYQRSRLHFMNTFSELELFKLFR